MYLKLLVKLNRLRDWYTVIPVHLISMYIAVNSGDFIILEKFFKIKWPNTECIYLD